MGLGIAITPSLQPAGRALTKDAPMALRSVAAAWRHTEPVWEHHVLLRCGVAGTRWKGPELRQPRPHDAQVESADRRPYVAIGRQLHTHVMVVRLGEGDWHDPYGRYVVRR